MVLKHECPSEDHPILRYRENVDEENHVTPVCECVTKMQIDTPGFNPVRKEAVEAEEEAEFVPDDDNEESLLHDYEFS